jgi:dTDP-4-dehydrorhamnose 3,5-epimerase
MMEIIKALLPGVLLIKTPEFKDNRGSLSVPFNTIEFFNATGNQFGVTQTMYSISKPDVLRGLHYQDISHPVAKIVSCLKGRILDVIVDLRSYSPSFGKWASIELSGDDQLQVFIPAGTAHGFLSLDDSVVFYYQQGLYDSESSRILSWDDKRLNIDWIIDNPILSERDRNNGHSFDWYVGLHPSQRF